MKKVKEIIGRLTAGSLRLAALFVALGLAGNAWAAAASITVNGSAVTISNENVSQYAKKGPLTFNSTWQSKNFWLPTDSSLASGTYVKISTISFAVPKGESFVSRIGLAGAVSSVATVTSGGFSSADADKHTFTFANSDCIMTAGAGWTITFRDANGEKVATSKTANFMCGYQANQYIDNLVWSSNCPIIEVTGEIVASVQTGTATAIGNSGTSPIYLFGLTGWLDTENNKTGPIILSNNGGTAALGVNNANSVNGDGRHSTWSKLSGSGTLTSLYTSSVGDKSSTSPVLEVYDSSEFTGSIVTPVNNGPKLSVVFCNSSESGTLKNSYNGLFNHSSGSNPASIYVSAGRTTANNAVVTIPAQKTWVANKLLNNGEVVVDGAFTGPVANTGTLTVNGTVTGAVANTGTLTVNGVVTGAVTNEGTLTLNGLVSGPITGSGALTLNAAGSYNLGARRDYSNVTIASGVTLSITMTAEEYGKGTVSVTGATGANGISTITVLAPDGTTEVTTLTPENGEAAYDRGSVLVAGKACWVDYEMNGNNVNAGVEGTVLHYDSGYNAANSFYNGETLYTSTHPYRDNLAAYPDSWTAVVRCTVPNLANAAIITFGNQTAGLLGLIAGDNPETQMKLVQTTGNSAYETKATMDVLDATSAQHVYVFAVENGQTLKCWSDGSLVLNETLESPVSIGAGFQIGSVVYGVGSTGIVRWWPGDTVFDNLPAADKTAAQIDCLRLYDYILSAEQISALSAEFPAVKLYRATAAADANTAWGSLSWAPAWDGGNDRSKAILTTEGNATIALPETITADEVELLLATDSTLTLSGPGSLEVTKPITIGNGTLKLTGTVTLAQDLAFNGSVVFDAFTAAGTGTLKLSDGATVGVANGSVIVTPLGSYTCAQGTVVDSAYTGTGVKLIPLTSAVVSITQSGTTQYYSSVQSAFSALMASTDEAVVFTLLTGDVDAETATTLQGMNYYVSGNTVTKAVAKIVTTTYDTLAAAIAAATGEYDVELLRNSSEAITLNKAITLDENGKAFNGTLTGNGTLTFAAFRNNPSITFDNWTGSVVLPSFTAGGTIFNKYGVAGSTVVLKGITSGWLGETSTQRMDVNPVLQIDGNVTITGFSTSWDYTFAEITGTGTFSLDPADNHPKTASITKVSKGFTGTIYSDIDTTLTIGTLDREEGTLVTPGTKLLKTSGSGAVSVSAVTLAGEATNIVPMFYSDGIYVAAATVTKDNVTTPYISVSAALTAAGEDAATITLYDNVETITLAPGQVLVTNGKTVTTVSGSENGVNVVNNNGTWTVVDNRTSTWAPKNDSTDWSAAANWSTGFVPTQYTAVTIPASTSVTLPAAPVCASIAVADGAELNLNGAVSYSGTVTGVITFTGTGTFTCGATDTLQGTIKGANMVTIAYPAGVEPTGATWTNPAWTGTLVLTTCGFLATEAETPYRTPFEFYGNANSKIKAPGFVGYAALQNASENVCQAELVIDADDTFEINHGTTAIVAAGEDVGYFFRKLSGAGELKLDGDTDKVQYVFKYARDFAGSVTITDPSPTNFEGGKKSFVFGDSVDLEWEINDTKFPAYLVIDGNLTVAASETWTVPAGIVVVAGKTLTLDDGSSVTLISKDSEGTVAVAADAEASIGDVEDGAITANIVIPENGTLNISDTAVETLTLSCQNAGTLNLTGCAALKTLHLDYGNNPAFNFNALTLPNTCEKIYLDVGTKRDMAGYTLPAVANVAYYAQETAAEYGGSTSVTFTNVDGSIGRITLRRFSGTIVTADVDTNDSTKRIYSGGAQFAGAACWHEWDFEDNNGLGDTGRYGIGALADPTKAIPLQANNPQYKQVEITSRPDEHKIAVSTSSHPYANVEFGDTWSAAVRCSMPTVSDKVAVAFGSTSTGVLGLANVGGDVVQLFSWKPGDESRTILAQLKVEQPSVDNNMHIYVFVVTTAGNKKYVEFYRDGEFIHKSELNFTASFTTFKVGAIAGDIVECLPSDAADGQTDYVRLYDEAISADTAAAISARRPFVSAKETYLREVSVGSVTEWSATGEWTMTKAGGTAACPTASDNVTVTSPGGVGGALAVNLSESAKYGTLIFSGSGDIAVSRGDDTGTIGAEMLVVRTGIDLTVAYDAVDFSDTAVNVDEGASLEFDLSNYPFGSVATTADVYLTGAVVAKGYDPSVVNRISVTGAPASGFFTISEKKWSNDNRLYVTITRNYKSFTVDVPANTVVTVNGAAYTAGKTLNMTIGTAVTINYAADGAYVASGDQSKSFTVGSETESAIAAPSNYTTTAAVAQIEGGAYYTTLQGALDAVANGETIRVLANITESTYQTAQYAYTEYTDKSFTIDFNGKTVTTSASSVPSRTVFNFVNKGSVARTVTLTGGTITAVAGTYNCVRSQGVEGEDSKGLTDVNAPAAQTINIHNMTLNNNQGYGVAIKPYRNTTVDLATTTINSYIGGNVDVQKDSKVVINSGTYTQTGGAGVTGDSDTCRVNVSVSYGGEAEILGGTFTSSRYGFEVCSSGGTITIANATATASEYVFRTTGGNGTIEVAGGQFKGAYASTTGDTIAISGGTFDVEIPLAYCADGYIPKDNGDTTYGVEPGYVITFVNEDDTTVLAEVPTAKYTIPEYTGTTPTKAATAQYTYTFNDWDPTLAPVTGPATYTATYSTTVNEYTITWKNDDGSTIDTTQVAYGTVPTHADAEKEATAEYIYTFNGWTPEVVAVNGNATYTATYTSAPNTKIFIVVVPENTIVTYEGVNYSETFQLKKPIGTVLQLTYTPVEGYVGTEVTESVTVTVATETVSSSAYVAPVQAVAVVDDVYYTTLQAAINAAVLAYSDEAVTVTLLKDVTDGTGLALFNAAQGTYPAANGVEIIVDFGGYTYTVVGPAVGSTNTRNQVLHFESGNTVTLMGGTINIASGATGFEMFMQNYGSLTIDGMEIDATGIAVASYNTAYYQQNWPNWYGTSKPQFNYNTAGNSYIRNSTITVTGDISIDDSASLTIEGTAVINANKIVTKGTDERYASANPTIVVENGAAFSFDCSAILADNQKLVEDAGVYTVASANYVAQVGSTKYESLADAVAAAESGDTITVLGNLTETIYSPASFKDKALTVDGNGKMLTSNTGSFGFYLGDWDEGVRAGTSSIALSNATVSKAGGNYTLLVDAMDATISDVTINGAGNSALSIANGGTMTLTDVTVVNTGYNKGTSATWRDAALSVQSIAAESTLNVESGAYSSEHGYALYVFSSGGVVNISGGTFSGKLSADIDTNSYPNRTTTINISGGVFTNCEFVKKNSDKAKFVISGGTFDCAVPEEYCAEGYIPTYDSTTGTYGVKQGEYVARNVTTGQGYESLADAVAAAESGDTVTLLADIDFRSQFASSSARYAISKSLTIDGDNHTIQVAGRGFGVGMNATSNVNVTFKDVTIVNASYAGRCIDTRGNLASLTLDHVTLDTAGCPGGYNQPLTIGGNQSTAATVTIKNGSVIQTNNEGTAYYAIITFNPVNMTITDSTIKGWACIYAKGPDGSAGSAGSVFTITDSALVSKNVYSGKSNAFGLIVTEDDNIDVSITGTTINIDGESNTQAILTGQSNNNLEGVNVALGEGNVVTLANSATFATNCSDTLRLQISGGTFNIPVPENCCADGCIPTEIESGVYGVKEGGYVARIGTTKYETLAEAMAAAQNGDTVVMLLNTTLAEPLNIELGTKAVTLDLGGKTLTGRTNLKNGNLTVQNGTVAGGAQQALNVYGSATPAEKYSVLTIATNVTVTADVYGVCLFGPTYNAHNGYGAVINIAGTVTTTGDSKNGAVFVSGNLGWDETGDANNVINVTGSITSATDAAIALNGLATVNVSDGVAVGGNTAIAVKRGTLKVTGGTIHATGADNTESVSGNNNGAEMTGAAISITPTYSKYGPLSVAISGGTIYSDNAVALFKKEGTYQSAATVAVSGGRFNSPVLADFCAVSCTPCELGAGWYSVEIAGTYDVEVPGAGVVATEAAAQAIAEAATVEDIKLPVEVAAELKTGADVAAYQSVFKYEVTEVKEQEVTTGYTVTPVLNPEATVKLTGDTEETPVKAVSTGADMEGEAKIEIKTIPGLYYSVSVSDTVDGDYAPVGESADATMATAKTMKLDVDDIVPEEAGSTKYIKVTTTATSNQTGTQVKSTTTVGVMKTDTPKKLEIVPVPWKGVGEENATVKVSDIIKTSTLDEGAKIHVADGENGYNTWKLQGGKWVALNTTVATQPGQEAEPEAGVAADSIDVPQGGAFWVEQETPKPIVMIGEVGTPPTKKEVAAGTSGLCASPKGEEFSLSDITGVGVNDSITVLDEDGKPINLSYRNGGWKVLQFNTTTRKNEWATPDADLLKIKAGAGFWFNNHSGSKRTINWNR